MPRRKRETHVWYVHGDDVISVESYSRKLNNAVKKLKKNEPDAVILSMFNPSCPVETIDQIIHFIIRPSRRPESRPRSPYPHNTQAFPAISSDRSW